MLRTLNDFKSKYKTTSDLAEREHIHKEVAEYTRKWLDAKNV